MKENVYPCSWDKETVYRTNVVRDPSLLIGDYTIFTDFVRDPREFEKNNVLYHYPSLNQEKLVMGKFCSIACGARFVFTAANHAMGSLATYPFPIFAEEWGLDPEAIRDSWDNKGDIVLGNDVWIGYEAVILQGVTIGNGAVIGARAVVTKDVPPYAVVGGVPAKLLRMRFPREICRKLEALAWWDWPKEKLAAHIKDLQQGRLENLTK